MIHPELKFPPFTIFGVQIHGITGTAATNGDTPDGVLGNPVVPGVILCEILAQSACVLLQDSPEAGLTPMYSGIDKVRFRRPVRPGECIETCCRIKRAKHPFYFAEGSASVNGELCISGDFSFALVKGE